MSKAADVLTQIVDLIAIDVARLAEKLQGKKTVKNWTVDDARMLGIYADRLGIIARREEPGTNGRTPTGGRDELIERALAHPELRDALLGRLRREVAHAEAGETE